MQRVRAISIEEPELLFGHRKPEADPRIGLREHGPILFDDEEMPSPRVIRVGIISTGSHTTEIRQLLEELRNGLVSSSHNKFLHPSWPGFNQKEALQCSFTTSERWNEKITDDDIAHIRRIVDPGERIAVCANKYVEKISILRKKGDSPDVIICGVPTEVDEMCGKGTHGPKPTEAEIVTAQHRRLNKSLSEWGVMGFERVPEKDFDLHNALKGKAMQHHIPVQLLREKTTRALLKWLDGADTARLGVQDPAEFAWNFSTALYYKAKGRPWRLAQLTPGTCYVGISFFRNKRKGTNDIQYSMAQVFTHNLEGLVVRGTEVTRDERTLEPHMTEAQAAALLKEAIDRYTEIAGKPDRVVIHKSSRFNDSERAGIQQATGSAKKDLVAITNTTIRFVRRGDFPILRGTLIHLSPREHLLYTSGYTPRLRTYPGARIPEPLLLTHDGDMETTLVAREILGLSKLDWNTTSFSSSIPITLGFAHRVGNVLSELENDALIIDEYRFFM